MKKNLFFTFIFSFIPGAGQMYQEYMKRGLSIMSIFAILFILACVAGSPIFIIPLLVIEAYSFFDTYNLRNMSNEKREKYIDDYVWNSEEFGNISNKSKNKNVRKVVGYILIVIGAYVLVDSVLFRLAWQFDVEWLTKVCNFLSRYIPTIAASLIAVFVGIKLVSSNQKED